MFAQGPGATEWWGTDQTEVFLAPDPTFSFQPTCFPPKQVRLHTLLPGTRHRLRDSNLENIRWILFGSEALREVILLSLGALDQNHQG